MKPKLTRRRRVHGRYKWRQVRAAQDRLELPPAIRSNDLPEPDYPRINGGKRKRKKSPILPFVLQKVPKLGRKRKHTVHAIKRREQGLLTRASRVLDPQASKHYSDYQFWRKLRELQISS